MTNAIATTRTTPASRAGRLVAGAVLAVALFSPIACLQTASAETLSTAPVDAGESAAAAIESATADLEAAEAECIAAGAQAFALEQHGKVMENMLPLQQQRSDEAARQLYKLQKSSYTTIDLFFQARSLDEFLRQTEYLDHIAQANVKAIHETEEMNRQIQANAAQVQEVHAHAAAQLQEAADELEAAYAERIAKQSLGVANSQSQDGANTAALNDGVNWRCTQDEFVAEWAPRLDAYLAGSALDGQGEHFARSAWKYCIDPRWSAAISNTESGKGAKCIRPHNAWGWGAADTDPYGLASEWASWETAIDAHARGLANGYGYTISVAGARAYCPKNWKRWYDWTLSEMARI